MGAITDTCPTTVWPRKTNPSHELLIAVMVQAVEDLGSADEMTAWEAHEFWLQERGAWAESRAFFLGALGLNEDAVRRGLRGKLQNPPPERPERFSERPSNYRRILSAIPADETVTASQVAARLDLHPSDVAPKLHWLRARGDLIRIRRGVFARADSGIEPDPEPVPLEDKILAILREHDVRSIRQIGFDLEGEVDTATIRRCLGSLVARRLVISESPDFRLAPDCASSVPDTQVAA
jgi:hypothetical protein